MKSLKKIVSLALTLVLMLGVVSIPVEAASMDKPYVVVSDYSIEGDAIVPGEDFNLTLTLKNTSDRSPVGSVLITLTSENNVIKSVYGESNQAYIAEIPAGGEKQVTIPLTTEGLITSATIALGVGIAYSDYGSSGNQLSSTLNLPINASGNFNVEKISLSNTATIGTRSRISITYGNNGNGNLSNIKMHVEGAALTTSQEFDLESLTAGGQNYSEVYLDYVRRGTYPINISFTYTDADGVTHETERVSYEISVDGTETVSGSTVAQNANEFLASQYIIYMVLLMAIVMLAVVIVRIYKKTKN